MFCVKCQQSFFIMSFICINSPIYCSRVGSGWNYLLLFTYNMILLKKNNCFSQSKMNEFQLCLASEPKVSRLLLPRASDLKCDPPQYHIAFELQELKREPFRAQEPGGFIYTFLPEYFSPATPASHSSNIELD